MNDKDKLRRTAKELHERVTDWGDSIFFPTGGVFLTLNREKLMEGIRVKRNPSHEVAWQVYAQWHETVHMLQLATSPFVFMNVLGLSSLAKMAANKETSEEELESIRESYTVFSSRLFLKSREKISHWHLLEAHAVAQGLLWLSPREPDQLWSLADHFYDKNHEYLKLPNWCRDQLGQSINIKLFCRLSAISLQSDDPISMFQGIVLSIKEQGTEKLLTTCEPQEFCERLGIAPEFISKSLRERESPFKNHPYMETLSIYFDEYENLDITERLSLLLCKDATSASFFKPLFTVYPDGDVTLSRNMPEPLSSEYKELIIDGTLRAMKGLDILSKLTG